MNILKITIHDIYFVCVVHTIQRRELRKDIQYILTMCLTAISSFKDRGLLMVLTYNNVHFIFYYTYKVWQSWFSTWNVVKW